MKIDPRDLIMLAAIVEHGSMVRAAEALGRAQPSLSRALAALELRVGLKLFEPGRRPLRPTALGSELAAQGEAIAHATRIAGSAVRTHGEGRSGGARVGGTPIIMDGVVSGMIALFQTAYPDVRIDQSYDYAEGLREKLSSGSIDLGICPLPRVSIAPPFAFEQVMEGRNVLACAPSHPLARHGVQSLEDIAPYPWVAPPAGSPLYEDLKHTLRGIGMTDFKVSFSGGTLSSVMNVLQGSEAITVLPYSVVYLQQQYRTLTALPVPIHHPDRQLGMLWRSDRPQRPAVQRLKAFIRREFELLNRRIQDAPIEARRPTMPRAEG